LALLVQKIMATLKQTEANRHNALKSTGPKTPEGKAAVTMNALRHGLRARSVVLPGEDRDEFQQLCDDLEVEWQPQSRTEQFYVEQMAVSQWKLVRMEVGESNVRQGVTGTQALALLDRLWQAQFRLERSYARAQRELERLQNSRPPQVDPPAVAAPAPQPPADVPAEPEPASSTPIILQAPRAAAVSGPPSFRCVEPDLGRRNAALPSQPGAPDSGPAADFSDFGD
jgi:hypothetical protein